jgi:hypothetical protein
MTSRALRKMIKALVLEERPLSNKFEDAVEILYNAADLLRDKERQISCTQKMDALMFDRLVYGTRVVSRVEMVLKKNDKLWSEIPDEAKKLFQEAHDKAVKLTDDDNGPSEAV